jgi:hypothetical protein
MQFTVAGATKFVNEKIIKVCLLTLRLIYVCVIFRYFIREYLYLFFLTEAHSHFPAFR